MNDDEPSVARYPHTRSNVLPVGALVCIMLAVAVSVLGVVLAAAQAEFIIDVPKGVFSLIGAAISATSVGAIALASQAALLRRMDRLERQMRQQREEGFAEGFVTATAGRPRLQAVNDR